MGLCHPPRQTPNAHLPGPVLTTPAEGVASRLSPLLDVLPSVHKNIPFHVPVPSHFASSREIQGSCSAVAIPWGAGPKRQRLARKCHGLTHLVATHICWMTELTFARRLLGTDMVTILVGKDRREFQLHRKLLCDTSSFFKESLETPPEDDGEDQEEEKEDSEPILWLPIESPEVFELFVIWLYKPRRLQAFIDDAIKSISPGDDLYRVPKVHNEAYRSALRWNLVRLHLFAELIQLPTLQDIAMDALQDIYLRCDWDVSPHFVAFLYRDCSPDRAIRLRRWAVAMLGWTLHGGDKGQSNESQFHRLFAAHPDLLGDYRVHMGKMTASKADVRIKNPQLRLPGNNLRSEERMFGFRQCSFHSHRAIVGEGSCPHMQSPVFLSTKPPRKRKTSKDAKEQVPTDSSDAEDPIISPVRDLTQVSFLDLS